MERLELSVWVGVPFEFGEPFVRLEQFGAFVLLAGLFRQVLFRLFHRLELALLAVGIVEALALLVLFRLVEGHNCSFLLGKEQEASYFEVAFFGIPLGCCKEAVFLLFARVVRWICPFLPLVLELGFVVYLVQDLAGGL